MEYEFDQSRKHVCSSVISSDAVLHTESYKKLTLEATLSKMDGWIYSHENPTPFIKTLHQNKPVNLVHNRWPLANEITAELNFLTVYPSFCDRQRENFVGYGLSRIFNSWSPEPPRQAIWSFNNSVEPWNIFCLFTTLKNKNTSAHTICLEQKKPQRLLTTLLLTQFCLNLSIFS